MDFEVSRSRGRPIRETLVGVLTSARTAAVLMVALAVLVTLGVLVPQENVFGEEALSAWAEASPWLVGAADFLGLHTIFTGTVFAGVVGLLAVNIIACTVQRIARRRRRRAPRLPSTVPSSAAFFTAAEPVTADSVSAAARPLWLWQVSEEEGKGMVLRRGRYGFTGSVVAHVALVILAIGALVSGATRFSGSMALTVGQSMPDALQSYIAVTQMPTFGSPFGDFVVTLDGLDFEYSGDVVTEAIATMTVRDATGARTEHVRVNRPLRVANKSFLIEEAGYSVALRVMAEQETLLDSFIALGERVPSGFSDVVTVGGETVHILAVPNAGAGVDEPATTPLLLTDPLVLLRDGDGAEVRLRPGATGRLGALTVTVADVRLWNRFQVRADHGLPFVYLAFGLAVLGMAVRLLDPELTIGVLFAPADGEYRIATWRVSRLAGGEYERFVRRLRNALARSEE